MASDRAAITLHRKKQGRQMARYRFNKKVRSNNRNKYENIDIRKVEYSHIDIALYKHRNRKIRFRNFGYRYRSVEDGTLVRRMAWPCGLERGVAWLSK